MLKTYKVVLAFAICTFFSVGCTHVLTNASIMQVRQSGAGPSSLDEFKANLTSRLAKYRIDPSHAALKANPSPGTIEYYFHLDDPYLLQVFGEAASIPVAANGSDGVSLKVLPIESDPSCNTTTCYSTTICGANPPQCYKKKSCAACPP